MTPSRRRPRRGILAAAVLLAAVGGASAAHASSLDSGNASWVLTSAALVLMMTIPGLSLFYGGLVRTANVLSVLMQCFAVTCIVTVLWVVAGYSLAFGEGNALIGDFSHILFLGVGNDTLTGTVPESGFAVFQLTFAIITPALIVGAFAERMRFSAAVSFAALWSMLVYVPIVHWVWGGGWLQQLGLMDASGGTVVHVAAGTAALVAAVVLGPRHGFPDNIERPHNMTLTVAGAGLLWVGWFGFNGGSALAANGDASMALTVTHVGAAAGALTWMLIEWSRYGKPSALGVVTGMVAGLGTITPASGFVTPAAALLIGAAAGSVCFFATNIMNLKLRIDDSLDVFPVHAVGGALGTMLTAVFAGGALGFLGGTEDIRLLEQLRIQGVGVLAVALYTVAATYGILRLTGWLIGNRVSEDDEIQGLDVVSHDESGYNL